MAEDADAPASIPLALIEWRLRQVEHEVKEIKLDMAVLKDRQVTRGDFQELKDSFTKSGERGVNFWLNSVGAPVLVAIIVSVLTIVGQHSFAGAAHP